MTSFDLPSAAQEPPQEDLANIEALNDALISGDPKRLEAARSHLASHGVDRKRFETIVKLRRLREDIHRQDQDALYARIERDPAPTDEELSMGAFAEMIESPARDAMLSMRRKGYDTASSGFNELDYQSVNLRNDAFSKLPKDVLEKLAAIGVEIDGNDLVFRSEEADAEAIKDRWQAIAALLPDLGQPAPDSDIPASKLFRERAANGELAAAYGKS